MDMEKSVTSRVERALTLAGKIEHQESRTVPGATVIKVFFQPGADPERCDERHRQSRSK